MNGEKLIPALKIATVAGSGLFSGAAVYALLADLPALQEHDYKCILKILRLKFWRVAMMQSSFVMLSGVSGITLYFMDKEKHFQYLVAGSLMLGIGPFTRFAILPKVHPLLRPEAKEDMKEEEVRGAVSTFQKLHAVRCLFSLSAFGYLLFQLTK